MFAIFLFLVIFSFYCCLAYEIQQTVCQQRSKLATKKIVPSLQPASALRVLLDSKSQAEERISVVAPMPRMTSEPKAQVAVPITLSSAQVEAPIARQEETDLALEIIDTSSIIEPAIIVNHAQKLALDDIITLKMRPARIVASALNIKQKANGTDKSLEQLRQEIKLCLQHKPELVVQALQLVKVG
jgi:hypothetical protein